MLTLETRIKMSPHCYKWQSACWMVLKFSEPKIWFLAIIVILMSIVSMRWLRKYRKLNEIARKVMIDLANVNGIVRDIAEYKNAHLKNLNEIISVKNKTEEKPKEQTEDSSKKPPAPRSLLQPPKRWPTWKL
ncbi:uncharacterized protein LOC111518657 [Drosophila willistoni]|uniref:uncharacterized protein LOC111518657 n=1 Tax=Drosophila willistoni TaxID=7260 RepID=UPI001F07DDC4|nr:uncharacterized protein LOC111518657 [Drosophila willistoni]